MSGPVPVSIRSGKRGPAGCPRPMSSPVELIHAPLRPARRLGGQQLHAGRHAASGIADPASDYGTDRGADRSILANPPWEAGRPQRDRWRDPGHGWNLRVKRRNGAEALGAGEPYMHLFKPAVGVVAVTGFRQERENKTAAANTSGARTRHRRRRSLVRRGSGGRGAAGHGSGRQDSQDRGHGLEHRSHRRRERSAGAGHHASGAPRRRRADDAGPARADQREPVVRRLERGKGRGQHTGRLHWGVAARSGQPTDADSAERATARALRTFGRPKCRLVGDSGLGAGTGRGAEGWRVGGLRHRCAGRCDQFHPAQGLRGRRGKRELLRRRAGRRQQLARERHGRRR